MPKKGFKQSPECIAKRMYAHIGAKRSEASKKKMSDMRIKYFSNGGKTWNKGIARTEIEKQNICNAVKKAWINPEAKAKMLNNRKYKSFGKTSSLEKAFRNVFNEKKVNYVWNYETTLGIKEIYRDRFSRIYYHKADFYLPNKNLIIEINGCWWHGCKLCYSNPSERQLARIQRDNDLVEFYKNEGYNYMTIWEHELKDKIHSTNTNPDKVDFVVNKILER